MRACVRVYMCMLVNSCLAVHVYVFMCACFSLSVCLSVCVSVCTSVSVCVFVCACMCVFESVHGGPLDSACQHFLFVHTLTLGAKLGLQTSVRLSNVGHHV